MKLENGHAVVGMDVDNKYAPLIHDDSSLLLRPKTGLNDMVVEVDPGTQSSPEVKEGSTIPLASTQPQVNPDEILASLDADTQQFLKLLLANGAEALDPAKGRDVKLSNALRRLDPFARDIARISGALATRRQNIANSIHNFQLLSTELGNKDQDLTNFVDSSNAVLASFARRGGLDPKRRQGAARHAEGDQGRADQRQRPRAAVRAGAQEAPAGCEGDRPRRCVPCGRSSSRRPARSRTRSGPSPSRWRARCSTSPRSRQGLGVGDPRLKTRLHRPQRRAQRARLQPARGPGGLPLLRPLAEPQPGHELHRSRTPTGRSAAAIVQESCCDRPAPPRQPCSPSPTCGCSTSSPASSARLDPTSRDATLMGQRAPTVGQIAVAVAFAFSCFGLLLFLWIDLRRPDSAEARGLPGQGAVQRGDPARASSPTCGSATSPSAR